MKNNIQKVYSKLPKKKLGLKKHKIDLGIVDDLKTIKNGAYQGTLDTANKVVDIAIKVNNILNNVTDDVRYYNDYKKIAYEDLGSQIGYVQELMDKATAAADELGIDVESLDGFQEAKEFVIDAKSVSGYMLTNSLEFDI